MPSQKYLKKEKKSVWPSVFYLTVTLPELDSKPNSQSLIYVEVFGVRDPGEGGEAIHLFGICGIYSLYMLVVFWLGLLSFEVSLLY